MSWAVVGIIASWVGVIGAAVAMLWWLRRELKAQGATEEREKQTYRKIEGVEKANEAKDDVSKLSDSAVSDWLRKWHRR